MCTLGGKGSLVSSSSLVRPKKANTQDGGEADGSGEGEKRMRCLPLSEGVGDRGLLAIAVVVEIGMRGS